MKELLGFWVEQLCWMVSHFAERKNVKNTDGDKILNFVLAICLNYFFLILCIWVFHLYICSCATSCLPLSQPPFEYLMPVEVRIRISWEKTLRTGERLHCGCWKLNLCSLEEHVLLLLFVLLLFF